MTDIVDKTQDRLDQELELKMKYRPAPPIIDGTGHCLECGSPVEPIVVGGRKVVGRWCSTECRDIWDRGD